MANLWHQNSKNWSLCMQYDWRLGPTNSQTEHCCLPFSTWKFSLTGPEFMTKLTFQSSTQIHQTRQIQKNPLCRWVSKICDFKSNRICRDGALVILQLKKWQLTVLLTWQDLFCPCWYIFEQTKQSYENKIIHVTVLTKSKAGLASTVLYLNCLVTYLLQRIHATYQWNTFTLFLCFLAGCFYHNIVAITDWCANRQA